jgi:hypothetical protein
MKAPLFLRRPTTANALHPSRAGHYFVLLAQLDRERNLVISVTIHFFGSFGSGNSRKLHDFSQACPLQGATPAQTAQWKEMRLSPMLPEMCQFARNQPVWGTWTHGENRWRE